MVTNWSYLSIDQYVNDTYVYIWLTTLRLGGAYNFLKMSQKTFLQVFVEKLHKIPKFHPISWCGNFVETHSFRRVLDESLETIIIIIIIIIINQFYLTHPFTWILK